MLCNFFNIDDNFLLFNNFDDDEDIINEYVEGIKISDDELKEINDFIDFDFNNYNHNEVCHVIQKILVFKDDIFKINDAIKFNKVQYETVIKNKNHYYKFEGDETLYIKSFNSYIYNKKELFLIFIKLLSLVNQKLEDDIKQYLFKKYFSNINKCKYYDCLRWFVCMFIYWFNSILEPNSFNFKINYKDFRKYFLNYRQGKKSHVITKEILIKFKSIQHNKFKYYEELKTFLNFAIFYIFEGYYKLK